MKKTLAAALFAICTVSPAFAADVNVNDGDAIKIATTTGLAGSMRFVAKEMTPGTYVDIPLGEGHVQLTFRIRGNTGLVSFTQTFDGAIISNPIYVAPGHYMLSGVYIDRSNQSFLRIQHPNTNGRNLLVAGYILAF
jgi:opacity protein-like surface antigen